MTAQLLPATAAPACSDDVTGVNDRCPDWIGTYNHSGGANGTREDVGVAVAVAPDNGTVFVTGRSRDDVTGRDLTTVAFDSATGATRWTNRFDGGFGNYDSGAAIAVTSSHVFVTGRSEDSTPPELDLVTIAYDAVSGQRLWVDRLAGPDEVDDTGWAVAPAPDGGTVYVGGTVDDGAGVPGDGIVIAHDAATGVRRWSTRVDSGQYDGGLRVLVPAAGSPIYLAGGTREGGDSMNFAVTAIEAADPDRLGEILWRSTFSSGQGFDDLADAALSSDGSRIVLVGNSTLNSAPVDVHTVAFDAHDGARLWSAVYNGSRNAGDTAGGVEIVGSSAVVGLTGAEGSAGFDMVTRAYDLNSGAVRWTAIEGGGATVTDRVYATGSHGGTVYITGQTVPPYMQVQPVFRIEPAILTTVAYDAASGGRTWIARHNESGIGGDAAVALEVSPDGQRVYPAGTFIFNGASLYPVAEAKPYAWDMGVLAYDA